MDVLPIIGAIFVEALVALFSFAAAVLLFREYRLRRLPPTLFFGSAFFVFGASMLLLFVGQVWHAYGLGGAAYSAMHVSQFLLLLHGVFLAAAATSLYAPRWTILVAALAAGVSIVTALGIGPGPGEIISVRGMAFLDTGVPAFLMTFFGWLAALVLLAALPCARYCFSDAERRKLLQPDRLLMNAGLLGILFFVMSALTIMLQVEVLVLLNFVLLLVHAFVLLLGAMTVGHTDEEVLRSPLTILLRSLVFKAVGLNTAIFWTLAFLLLAVTASYFTAASFAARDAGLRRDVLYFTKSYQGFSATLLEETARLAALPEVSAVLADDANVDAVSNMDEAMGPARVTRRIIRVVDADGIVRYSNYRTEEVGTRIGASRVVEKALMGHKVAAIEKEDMIGSWTVRAAAPVILENGSPAGIVIGTDVSAAFDFTEYAAISPIFAAGYGFVSEGGEPVYTFGEPVDAVTRLFFMRNIGPSSFGGGDMREGGRFFAQRVYATDGVPNGFFYIFVTQEMVDGEVFRILSVVTLMTILAVILMTVVLLFGIGVVLRPIRELRAAADRVERGDYGVRIDYRSSDEIGQLSRAFNRMSATIADRTAALEVALREEKDFLGHTTRELRTPLNIFRWTLELMRYGDTGRLNREQLELLEQMNQTNERLIAFVKNLTEASMLETGRLSLDLAAFDPRDVVDEVAGSLAVRIRQKNINLHWNRPKDAPQVRADRERVAQTVRQVLSNAVKFTQVNGHIEVVLSRSEKDGTPAKDGGFMKVVIEDNGRGIPKDEQARVFSRFFRSRNVVGEEIEGTGLGLYLAKRLVELQGGTMGFESKEGTGTTFWFTLPIEKERT